MNKLCLLVLVLFATTCACAAREIVVTSTSDSGPGTLRWALGSATTGDWITFAPQVFPPEKPATIQLRSELPPINRPHSRLTIDASNAGVIIDGCDVPGEWNTGLQVYADSNRVMGLQIVNFAGSGIAVCSGSHNVIGGDRNSGTGHTGQGNLLSGNKIGIDLCGDGTKNAVTGNIIGTDASMTEDWHNEYFGVYIEERTHDNVIGPGNVFAYSDIGIRIDGLVATGNTITANSFHNITTPIDLINGGNGGLEAPAFTEVDIQLGRVAGLACPDCVVEVFVQTENARFDYVGESRAAAGGSFLFQSENPLPGETVAASMTDMLGSTSEFSSSVQLLQTGNPHVPVRLEVLPSGELAENRIGAHFCGLSHPYYYPTVFSEAMLGFGSIIDLGVKRARFAINDLDWYNVVWDSPESSIHPRYDEFIDTLVDNGIAITYVLVFWDKDYVTSGGRIRTPRFKTESEIQRYLDFVQSTVAHLKDRVDTYEMWTELSIRESLGWIEAEDYINVVRQTVPVISKEQPDARIVVGGTDFLLFEPSHECLFTIISSDIMPIVDSVSWHGMYGSSPEFDFHRDYYYEYPLLIREIKDVAIRQGFTGEFIADELNWQTPDQVDPTAPWPNAYSEPKCAKYYARGVIMNLGMDNSVSVILRFLKPLWYRTIKNLCTAMAGHQAIKIHAEIDIDYDGPVAYCAFRYLNGDRVLAVWTDGVTQEKDHGVRAIVRVPNLVAEEIRAIDVLHGLEQELIFEIQGEGTIVRDLLVKDYPILIRLSDVTMSEDYVETAGDGFHRLGDTDAAQSSMGEGSDRDGVPDDEDLCPDWPGSKKTDGC